MVKRKKGKREQSEEMEMGKGIDMGRGKGERVGSTREFIFLPLLQFTFALPVGGGWFQ